MSESQGTAWGMCAAYGCPMFGTMGNGSSWVCFVHANRMPGTHDAITTAIRRHDAIAKTIIEVRSRYGTELWPSSESRIVKRLTAADRTDLLESDGDHGVQGWLARLEKALLEAVGDAGTQARMPTTVPTKPVIGPTHAMTHYTETEAP
jgi:hypothetical protein